MFAQVVGIKLAKAREVVALHSGLHDGLHFAARRAIAHSAHSAYSAYRVDSHFILFLWIAADKSAFRPSCAVP